MISITDQIGCSINFNSKAKKIISVVPSQTELLYHLGLENEVIGITKFCIHPNQWFKTKTRVGGTKTLKFDIIKSLNPDLIIANKEENTQTEIEFLQQHYNVYTSDIQTLDDAYKMMQDVGFLTNKNKVAKTIINQIKGNFKNLPQFNKKILYLIWKQPYMAAGQNTFINHLLSKIGLTNVVNDKKSRYVELSIEQIKQLNPDFIFLSSEPYPFKEKHIKELNNITSAQPILVDGEIFSWYGSRLKYFKNYIQNNLEQILKD